MSLTKADADDALMLSRTRLAQWQREFTDQWHSKDVKALAGALLVQLRNNPAAMQQMKRLAPEALKTLEGSVGNGH